MFEHDFDDFMELLDGAISLNPKWAPLNPTGKALFFKAMEQYPFDQVSMALMAHMRDPKAGMFQPTPAHLIGHIQGRAGNDGRPTADEAWAIALTSIDEADTVVWTEEAASAFALCRSVLNMGDEVGARRAFIDAYNRMVTEARASGKPAKWSASMGWDATKREAALTKAQTAGLLAAPVVREMLPNYATTKMQECPEGLKRVKEALKELEDARVKADRIRAEKVASDRLAVDQRKRELAEQAELIQKQEKVHA